MMGAEMDCCDSTDDGRRFYVELKTSREVGTAAGLIYPFSSLVFQLIGFNSIFSLNPQLDYHTEERFEREKLLKFWVHFLS